MKIVHDVLSIRLFKSIEREFKKGKIIRNWSSSHLMWDPHLLDGISGDCLIRNLPDDLSQLVKKEIEPYTPPFGEISILYQVWLPNSGIAIHDDSNHEWAATIYLNQKWPLNSGGWFLWQDSKDSDYWRAVSPTRNMMVINDKHENHCVTSVAPTVTEPRISLQIWSNKMV
tara:strand:- start:686 stop:1198 length:513 start_codon:yes stop_codon:yes gene_type:complete